MQTEHLLLTRQKHLMGNDFNELKTRIEVKYEELMRGKLDGRFWVVRLHAAPQGMPCAAPCGVSRRWPTSAPHP